MSLIWRRLSNSWTTGPVRLPTRLHAQTVIAERLCAAVRSNLSSLDRTAPPLHECLRPSTLPRSNAPLRAALLAAAITVACNQHASQLSAAAVAPAPLPLGALLRIGPSVFDGAGLLSAADHSGLSVPAASERLIELRLLGLQAAAGGLERGRYSAVRRGVFGRALLEQLKAEANAKGPPTTKELATVTQERWVDHDRPAASRVSHVVVVVKQGQSEQEAKTLSSELYLRLRSVKTVDAFLSAAREVKVPGLELRVESLPFVTVDGRGLARNPEGKLVADGMEYVVEFAQAAAAIPATEQLSPVVRSQFGFHILWLEERLPEQRVSAEERMRLLGPEVLSRRAREAMQGIVARQRSQQPVVIERAVLDTLQRARVEP